MSKQRRSELKIGGQRRLNFVYLMLLATLTGLACRYVLTSELGTGLWAQETAQWVKITAVGLIGLAGLCLISDHVLSVHRYPVFMVLKPTGVEVPGHSHQSWDEFQNIEAVSSELVLRGNAVTTEDLHAPLLQGKSHRAKVLAYIKQHAPIQLTAELQAGDR